MWPTARLNSPRGLCQSRHSVVVEERSHKMGTYRRGPLSRGQTSSGTGCLCLSLAAGAAVLSTLFTAPASQCLDVM